MKNYLLPLLASFAFFSCNYKTPTEDLAKFEIIDRDNNSLELDLESSKKILKAAKYTNQKYIWKGRREGILTYKDGNIKQINVSSYGGFFSDRDGKFFVIQEEHRKEWDELIWSKGDTANR